MDVVIMCAGLGTRLRPLTETIPKPLIPIAGRSALERTIDALPDSIDRIILVIGYLGEAIRERIGAHARGREVCYVIQNVLDGTGGALRRAEAFLRSERFMVLNGDDLYHADDLCDLVEAPLGVMYAMKTYDVPVDSWDVHQGTLKGLTRTKAGDEARINTGAYLLDRTWFQTSQVLVPGKTDEYGLPQAIPELIMQGRTIQAIEARFWMPVGTIDQLTEAERIVR